MAAVAKSGTPSPCTNTFCDANRLPPLLAGEDLAAGDACCVQSDGKVYRTDGNSGTAGTTAEVDGWAPMAAKAGRPVSLVHDVNFNYGTGLTPGTFLYVTDNGALQTTAATIQTKPVARVIDATRIRVVRSY